MKKSLLLILSAALLFVGCTKELEQKVTDLTSRVDQVEQQVAANKLAIEALQAQTGDRVTNVTQTSVGWTVTLSSGKTLVLYGGSTEAVFFKSVVAGEKEVTFTLADGSTIVLPVGEEDFALKLDVDDFVIYPETEEQVLEIAYEVVGGNAQTVVDVMPCAPYGAEVKDGKIVITVPAMEEGQAVPAAKIIAFADNGKGKTSIKAIIINGQIVEVAKVGAAAPFWAGTTTFTVPSNVPVTAELANEKDAAWCTVTATKAITDHKFTADCKVTPYADTRTAVVNILDPAGNIVQEVKVLQGGTGNSIYYVEGDKFVSTFDQAVAAIEAGSGDTGTIWVSASHGLVTSWETLKIPADAKKKYVIIPRPYGAETVEGPNQYRFRGAWIYGNVDVTIKGMGLLVSDATKNKITDGVQFSGYMCGLFVSSKTNSNINVENVEFFSYQTLTKNDGTEFVVDLGSQANVTMKGCTFDGTPLNDNYTVNTDALAKGYPRFAQIYGGTVVLDGNIIKNSYSSYGVRVGGNAKATFTDNLVDTKNFIDLHNGSAVAGECSCTLGDGVTDNNHYSANVEKVVKAAAANVALAPESAIGAPGQDAGNVEWNGYKFAKIQSAINFAGKEPAEITVGAGEYDENVKIANGTNITLKAAEGAILNGNIEIAGKANINGLTIKTKEGVTNNVLSCTVTGEGYNWGHIYLARVENGASDVTFENCTFDATLKNEDINSTMSMLWISQATNVKVLDCTFTSVDGGAYAPNQTHQADVIWSGCKFIGDTHKHWGIRAMDTDVMTVTKCYFQKNIAIDVYSDFKGSLTLGDGEADDNIYGPEVTMALCGDKDAAVTAGAVFAPADVTFNKPTTSEGLLLSFKGSYDEIGVADSRNIAFNNGKFYAAETGSYQIGTGALVNQPGLAEITTDGKLTHLSMKGIDINCGYTGAITGIRSLEPGKLLIANTTGTGNKWAWGNTTFKVYLYDVAKQEATVLGELDNTAGDPDPQWGPNGFRVGDYIDFYGTLDDGHLYTGCGKVPEGAKSAVLDVVIKGGKVESSSIIGLNTVNADATAPCITRIGDNFWRGPENGVGPTEIVPVTGGNVVKTFDNVTIKTPRLFTYKDVNYMAYVTLANAPTKAAGTGVVITLHVAPYDAENIVIDTENEYTATVMFDASKDNGNWFASCDVAQIGEDIYVGVGAKVCGMAIYRFKPAEKAE